MFKLANGLIDCYAILGHLTYKVPVKKIRQNVSFVNGNYEANYPITRMCKFANDPGIDVFEIDLIETEAILLKFERGTISEAAACDIA